MIDNLIKIKMLAVDKVCARRTMRQDLIINVGACIQANRRRLDQPYGSLCQEIRRARTCADEMNRHSGPLIALHCTTGLAGRQP